MRAVLIGILLLGILCGGCESDSNGKPNDTKVEKNFSENVSYPDRNISVKSDYEEYLKDIDSLLDILPERNHFHLWDSKGETLEKLGRYDEALEAYTHAINLTEKYNLNWSEPYENKANLYWKLERYNESLKYFQLAAKREPEKKTTWLNLGRALARMNRSNDALNAYDKALELGPEDGYTLAHKAEILIELRRFNESINISNKAFSMGPVIYDRSLGFVELMDRPSFDLIIYTNLGRAYLGMSDYSAAIDSFDKALEIDPTDEEALKYREMALANLSAG
ncbi:MAG: tetratricopeptide repeat protein [Euryarchaeota archaeon]|nr:tetratricopeptide repeat protein [Euryarchaeota archaeon]